MIILLLTNYWRTTLLTILNCKNKMENSTIISNYKFNLVIVQYICFSTNPIIGNRPFLIILYPLSCTISLLEKYDNIWIIRCFSRECFVVICDITVITSLIYYFSEHNNKHIYPTIPS